MKKRTIYILSAVLLLVALIVGITIAVKTEQLYFYSTEELESIYDEHHLYNSDGTIRPQLVTISSKDFAVFIEGETTSVEVERTVGKPHAFFGWGFVRDVYLTADKHVVVIDYEAQKISDGEYIYIIRSIYDKVL